MGREPTPEDFLLPRSDGKQAPNWKRGEEWYADLEHLRIHKVRHHDTRAVFRNLLLGRRAQKFHVDLMTHPSKKDASDLYTRPEMQWRAMCDAILLLDHPAWRGPATTAAAKPLGEPLAKPLGNGAPLDPNAFALLQAAPSHRADIAQPVEQRFRKP